MPMQICGAPASWGVDDPKNPYLPPWQKVLSEAHQAGYTAIELGPYGYLPYDNVDLIKEELEKNELAIVVGTIFHDLVDPANQPSVLEAVDNICRLVTDPRLPKLPVLEGQKFPTPYMTIMDWGHDERDYNAGHPDRAPRMNDEEWKQFIGHVLDYVHFKDVDQKVYEQVLGEHIRFFEGCGKGTMCPVGTGALDYPAIKEALEEIGYSGYITIEQERDPRNQETSLRDVKASVDYLKSVGYQI